MAVELNLLTIWQTHVDFGETLKRSFR